MERTYRIGEIAEQLGITPASVRNWISQFGDYLSEKAIRPTGKRFSEQDLATLREINSYLRENKTYNEILDLLPSIPQVLDEKPFEEIPPTSSAIQPIEFFENMRALMEAQQQQFETTIQAKDDLIQELKNDKTRLQDEIDQLRKQQRRSWLDMLFNRGND